MLMVFAKKWKMFLGIGLALVLIGLAMIIAGSTLLSEAAKVKYLSDQKL